jgi:2-oxoisovalerate dehydrogenase E1 component
MFDADLKTRVVAQGDLRERLLAFVLEQEPFAVHVVRRAFDAYGSEASDETTLRKMGVAIAEELDKTLLDEPGLPEPTPFVTPEARFSQQVRSLADAVRGFFEREALTASFTPDERRWMLEGIILTRAVDNTMKQLFLSGEMKYGALGFQGKGFRSLGQEAIYAGALRLKRGAEYAPFEGAWQGDVVAPLIRDLGMMLAFTDDPELALNAQVGKAGPPLDGKDLHLGDMAKGVLPAAAPLSIATCTVVGQALAMKLRGQERAAFSFIGDGGSSLGEWHEAINLAAVRKLPAVFCIQNNQTALSTRVDEQSRARTFADKALGYGIPRVTCDGTDPEAVAAAFAWAGDRARAGEGATLIELVAMRMCGHAHHDDMLYLGGDPELGYELPEAPTAGYIDKDRYALWSQRDPLTSYARRLIEVGLLSEKDVERMKQKATERCQEAVAALKDRPWPPGNLAGEGVFTGGPAQTHPAPAAIPSLPPSLAPGPSEATLEDAPAFSPKGRTFLDAIGLGLRDVCDQNPEAFIFGEDVGAPYGNAFLLLKPLLEGHADRLLNAPIAEGGIIGALVGASLEGMCPIGEMQFNDFVASGFNQLVNNAAKFRYRTGRNLPFVLRMPWGGLRRAGPYHSQDTSPWFQRSFGLKIVCPSTPHDARALIATAAADPDPVLFYEHIGLYRDPKIKQPLDDAPASLPVGTAAFRRLGEDLSIISYGAYVHRAMAAAERLAEDDIACDVLDLRWLTPLDWDRIALTVKRTGKVLLVGEDSRTGSILESIASRLGEALFEHLDGPIRVLGALDTPVPYAPSLEDTFLLSTDRIVETAQAMIAW